MPETPVNPERRYLHLALACLAVGVMLLVVPSLAGMDGFDGGYALGVIGIVPLIMGAIAVAFLLPRVRSVERILSGEGLLAHWALDEPDRGRQVRRDLRTQLAENRRLLLIVLAWWVLWVALFLTLGHLEGNGDEMPLFVGIMAGVLAVVTAAGLGIPYLRAWHARRSSPDAYIGRCGVLVGGTFHPWQPPWATLDSVTLRQDDDGGRLVFNLRARTGPGWLHWVPYTVEVPVPPAAMAEAERIIQELAR